MVTLRADLDAIEARVEAATKGPWKHVRIGGGRVIREAVHSADGTICQFPNARPLLTREANAAMLAAARTDLPRLVRGLRLAVEALANYDGMSGLDGVRSADAALAALDALGKGDT